MSLRGCHGYSWKENSPRSQEGSGLGTERGRHQLSGARTRRLALPNVCRSSSQGRWSLLSGAPTAPLSSTKPALGKRWGFSKIYAFQHGSNVWNEVNSNCIQIPWKEKACPPAPPSTWFSSTKGQNFFAKRPFQQCKSAPWYHFRRSRWQDTTLGLEEFLLLLSPVAYFDLLSGLERSWSLSWCANADVISTLEQGWGASVWGMSWLDSLTTWELMANHLTNLWWFWQLQSKMEI